MSSVIEDSIEEELRSLNLKFWTKSLEPAGIYESLERLGLEFQSCVLDSMFPDSGSTFILNLMDQNGHMMKLDVDVSHPDASYMEQLDTSQSQKQQGKFRQKLIQTMLTERKHAL